MREQALGLGDLVDVAESGLIARGGLLRGGARGGHLHGRIRGDAARAVQRRDGAVPLAPQIDRDLLRARGLRRGWWRTCAASRARSAAKIEDRET